MDGLEELVVAAVGSGLEQGWMTICAVLFVICNLVGICTKSGRKTLSKRHKL